MTIGEIPESERNARGDINEPINKGLSLVNPAGSFMIRIRNFLKHLFSGDTAKELQELGAKEEESK